ncbi:MAG: hypothetical protein FWE11_09295 [Defluviitaleaceae bacterium]|nr:hypothetical protein [Defluviitaleaceae bacterium]
MILKPEKLLVDGKKIGQVLGFQLTHNDEQQLASIRYTVNGNERALTCELEVISFED